jgi:Uma2 family endonuclease
MMERIVQGLTAPTNQAPPRFASFEEFIAWVDEDVSAEYIAGEVEFMSPASLDHQDLSMFLSKGLGMFVEYKTSGKLLAAPFKIKLNEDYGPEPDLIYISENNMGRLKKNFFEGAPDLVIEIVSPESFQRDRGAKFLAYETAGVPEYWLINPWRKQAEFYQLDGEGYYQLQSLVDGRYHSHILAGLVLPVHWLWQNPLPKIKHVLQEWQLLD